MGASHQPGQKKVLKPNNYFVSMTASPEHNKMQAEAHVMSMAALNQWSDYLQKLTQAHPESLLLPKQYKIIQRSVCGQSLRLQLEYDCYHISLAEQLFKRAPVEKFLEQTEIWYLVYTLVEAAQCCHKLGKPIGNVQPKNLLLSKEGKLRVLSRLSVPSHDDIYAGSDRQKGFCSPEEMDKIRKGYKEFHLDYVKSQSFSIGMTILAVGTLQQLSKCYNYSEWQLNMLEFNRILTFWHQNQFYSEVLEKQTHYSPQLKQTVLSLLQLQPERRMSSLDLYRLLLPHREAIMLLKPFQLDLSRSQSPKKKSLPKRIGQSQTIHKLRSRKSSSKGSPHKESNLEVSNFIQHLNAQFSFNSPPSQHVSQQHSLQKSVPTKRKKLNTSYALTKQKGEQFE